MKHICVMTTLNKNKENLCFA